MSDSQRILNCFVITFSLLSSVLPLIPLPFHLKMKNSGTCIYIFWIIVISFNQFINSIIWNGNVVDWAPVWCDISSRIVVAGNVAITAAGLCIIRHLYLIISLRATNFTRAQKQREIYIDLAIGMGLPLLAVLLYSIVQTNRYDIFEDRGCLPAPGQSPLTIVLFSGFPLYIALVTTVYCGLIVYTCVKHYREVRVYLKTASRNRYIRLAILAILNVAFTIPLTILIIAQDAEPGSIAPWCGWACEHSGFSYGFSTVFQYSYQQWTSQGALLTQFTRWFPTICALIFFAFFGFADEVWAGYRHALSIVTAQIGSWASWVLRKLSKPKPEIQPVMWIGRGTGPCANDLPMHHKPCPSRHDLTASFSPDSSFGSFDSSISLQEKYPWVQIASPIGSLPPTPLSLADGHPPLATLSLPPSPRRSSPRDPLESFSSGKSLLPRI